MYELCPVHYSCMFFLSQKCPVERSPILNAITSTTPKAWFIFKATKNRVKESETVYLFTAVTLVTHRQI